MELFALILQQSPAQPQQQQPAIYFGLQLLAIAAIFYVLWLRPMQRQKQRHAQMLKDLQNGNVVQTNGGIVGTIVTINNDDTLILRVKPDNVKLQVARGSVASLVTEEKKAT